MLVDGLGDRPVVDSGGFPVVWIGDASCTIGQDPNQGGTNCYGPGDVLIDSDTGAQYQIGSDWHLRQIGDQPSSSAPPQAPAATLVETIYYVDGGGIIQKDSYSDGTVNYTDTGMSSPLGDGTASSDPYSLQQPQSGGVGGNSGDPSGGFGTPNPVGGYGPYATPSPPQLTDIGTYVQNGELFDHQVDQYGNDYYTDLGPAPPSSAPPPLLTNPTPPPPRPSVPSPRATPPSVGSGPAPLVQYPVPSTAPEPVAADGQRLSGQGAITRAAFQALYGPNAAAVWAQQHNAAIGRPGASPPVVPTRTAAPGAPTPTSPRTGQRPTTAGPTGATPAITPTGNPTQFGHQVVNWLSKASFIGGVPNGVIALGGALGYSMLRNRRRR